jgi:ABC-type multidrug transport system fused ATPase/permease subunit
VVVVKGLSKNLGLAWEYAKSEKKSIIMFIIANIFSVVCGVILPILSAKIIIELTTNNYQRLILLAIMLIMVNIISDLFYYISSRCAIKTYHSTLSKLEVELGRNILRLENDCLDNKGSGLFIQRLTNDTNRIADAFNSLLGMFSDLIKYIGILVAIFIVNRIVFGYVFLVLIVKYILEKIRTDRRKRDDKESRKSYERVSGFIGELVRGARDIKMLNSENDFIRELDYKVKDYNSKRMKMQNNSWNYRLLVFLISDISNLILILLLIVLMEKSIIISSMALVLYNYSSNLSGSSRLLGGLLEYIKDFNLSSERVYSIIKGDEFKKERFGNVHLDKVKGDFEFKDVTFGYKDNQVLDKLNFKINSRETVAFVGKSGAGKTTIFSLLCKMYEINKGKITIDGVDINELDKDTIRGNITIISQNPYIFNMSIKDNLKLVKANLTDEEMKEACRIACLEEFIEELPDGYDTIIGEGGVNLSGGQKQRLAIARALVQKTEIILFDEATSSLDNETQEKIQTAIDNMKNDYTILIIAHRLSTIINADRILYLEEGKIKAEGTHKYLLKTCKEYKSLYETEIFKG